MGLLRRPTAICVLATFCSLGTASAATIDLEAGSTTLITPSVSTECFTDFTNDSIRATARGELTCEYQDGSVRVEMFATSGVGVGPVDIKGIARIVVAQIRVVKAPGAADQSYLPVHITVPVFWNGKMFNLTGIPAAQLSANMWLRLRESREDNPSFAGTLAAQTLFNGASHGGISNCLSVPTTKIAAAAMAIKCTAAAAAMTSGGGGIELSSLIRTNKVYNVEVVIRGELFNRLVEVPGPAYVPEMLDFKSPLVGDSWKGVRWNRGARIVVGTDPSVVDGDLAAEIAELRDLLGQLRDDFEGHYHTYRTGRGRGHNNTEARTPGPHVDP